MGKEKKLRRYMDMHSLWVLEDFAERNLTWGEISKSFMPKKSKHKRVHLPRTKVRR